MFFKIGSRCPLRDVMYLCYVTRLTVSNKGLSRGFYLLALTFAPPSLFANASTFRGLHGFWREQNRSDVLIATYGTYAGICFIASRCVASKVLTFHHAVVGRVWL